MDGDLVSCDDHAANICYGSVYFGVCADKSLIFFEVNLQGQWLWMEILNSDLMLLEKFVKMVCTLSGAARVGQAPVRFGDIARQQN